MTFPTQSIDLESSSSQQAYITDASQTGLDITGDLTIEAWVKLESQPTGSTEMVIASKWGNIGAQTAYNLVYREVSSVKTLRLRLNDGSIENMDVAHTLTLDTWTHVAVTFDSSDGDVEFFINGSSIGTDNSTHRSIVNGNEDFVIGGQSDDIRQWDGRIGLTRVWNVVRTPTQINDNKCTILGATTGLVGEWTFDNTYADNSGNGNTLTGENSPTFGADVASICGGGGSIFIPIISYIG